MIELEKENKSLLLDVLVKMKPDGSSGHSVYREPIHTDVYLHEEPENHPAQKSAIRSTLVHRARAICDTESLEA
jgi:hypothetical protein